MCAYPSRHNTGPHPSQDRAAPRGPGRLARSRVTKTLQPGQPGTTRWQHAYGNHLVCVRYREDLQANARYVTVELVLETRPLRRQPPPPIIRADRHQPRQLVEHDTAFFDPRPTPPDAWAQDEPHYGFDDDASRGTPTSAPTPAPLRQDNEQVGVRIALDEIALQEQAKQHGAQWNREIQLWQMPRSTAEKLGWQARIKHT